MKIIVFTQPTYVEAEAELILAALDAGAHRVHIRKPDWSRAQVAELISNIPTSRRGQLTLHDHFDLCEELGVGGVQINRRNRSVDDSFGGVVSRSCHSIAEAMGSSREDYVTLSPIYNSISKGGYCSNFSSEELLSADITPNIIAMGGVTPENIPHLHALGFGGVALLGYVWSDSSVEGVRSRVKRCVKMARMAQNFSLQYITHRNDRLDDVTGAEAALEGGCRWVQLRMKGFSDGDFISNAKVLRRACDDVGATFLLNDRVDLVQRCGADGVHIGKGDMIPSLAREILGEGAIIGGTANTCDDIDYLVSQGVDYIGLGPFRFTTTKERLSPTLGLEGYRAVVEHCAQRGYRVPIVAIGGITTEDIRPIMDCGVDGIALSGTILNAEDSVTVTGDIMKILRD